MSVEEDFANVSFSVECPRIVLERVGPPAVRIIGPGEIWQDEKAEIRFKLFADDEGFQSLAQYFGRTFEVGRLIPDEDFFNLYAEDYSGRAWKAEGIIPNSRGGIGAGIAHGRVHELVLEGEPISACVSDHVRLRFRGKVEFPCNQGTQVVVSVGGKDRGRSFALDAAFIDTDQEHCEIRHDAEHTVFSMTLPSGQLKAITATRIQESLQFVLGRELPLLVVETMTRNTNQRCFRSAASGNGKVMPPLAFTLVDEGGCIWRMFRDYFRFVHSNADRGYHPVSRHIANVIEASAASFDAKVLALGVAVEGLVSECFPELAPVNSGLLSDLNVVQKAFDALAVKDECRKRVNGAIGAMRSTRGSDLIRAFLRNWELPDGLFEAWRKLRNRTAHGTNLDIKEIEIALQQKHEVLVLMYSIVFAAIGYDGLRSDYSRPGWPMIEWSSALPAPKAQPSSCSS